MGKKLLYSLEKLKNNIELNPLFFVEIEENNNLVVSFKFDNILKKSDSSFFSEEYHEIYNKILEKLKGKQLYIYFSIDECTENFIMKFDLFDYFGNNNQFQPEFVNEIYHFSEYLRNENYVYNNFLGCNMNLFNYDYNNLFCKISINSFSMSNTFISTMSIITKNILLFYIIITMFHILTRDTKLNNDNYKTKNIRLFANDEVLEIIALNRNKRLSKDYL